MCDMTHWSVEQSWRRCLGLCDMTHSCVKHGSFTYVRHESGRERDTHTYREREAERGRERERSRESEKYSRAPTGYSFLQPSVHVRWRTRQSGKERKKEEKGESEKEREKKRE